MGASPAYSAFATKREVPIDKAKHIVEFVGFYAENFDGFVQELVQSIQVAHGNLLLCVASGPKLTDYCSFRLSIWLIRTGKRRPVFAEKIAENTPVHPLRPFRKNLLLTEFTPELHAKVFRRFFERRLWGFWPSGLIISSHTHR